MAMRLTTSLRLRRASLLAALLALLAAAPAPAATFDPGVQAAQSRLQALGFDPGPADGLLGRHTRSALRAFQTRRGLTASGRLDAETRRALGLESPPAPAASTAPAKAAPAAAAKTAPAAAPAAPAAPPAPARARRSGNGRLLTFESLGWHGPESGAQVLARYEKSRGSPDMGRDSSDMIVPAGADVYVLEPGAHVPGLDCDPKVGRIEIELMLGSGGPVSVRSLDGDGYCRLGFGVVLTVGQTLNMREAWWGNREFRAGVMRVAPRGLEYVSR